MRNVQIGDLERIPQITEDAQFIVSRDGEPQRISIRTILEYVKTAYDNATVHWGDLKEYIWQQFLEPKSWGNLKQ